MLALIGLITCASVKLDTYCGKWLTSKQNHLSTPFISCTCHRGGTARGVTMIFFVAMLLSVHLQIARVCAFHPLKLWFTVVGGDSGFNVLSAWAGNTNHWLSLSHRYGIETRFKEVSIITGCGVSHKQQLTLSTLLRYHSEIAHRA